MLVLFLFACGFVAAQGIVCLPGFCDSVKCSGVSSCDGGIKTKGGFCGCCDICVRSLVEGQSCFSMFLLGVPGQAQCADGLHCDRSSGKCAKTVTKRQAPVQAKGACQLRKDQLEKGHSAGLPLLGAQHLRCNNDGSYSPVQLQGSVSYCVDQNGVEISGYRTSVGSKDFATKNCQCARDKQNFQKTGQLGQVFNCQANGNYQQYQCRGSVCFCVDDNGMKLGTQTVTIGQLASLTCSSP